MYFDGDATTNPLNEFLKNWGIPLSFIAAGIVFTVVLVFFIIAMVKRKRNPDLMVQKPVHKVVEANNILSGLGGQENIIAHSLNGSRIVLVLKNYDLVNEEILNTNGVDTVIRMSNKITLVSKGDASKIYKGMFGD